MSAYDTFSPDRIEADEPAVDSSTAAPARGTKPKPRRRSILRQRPRDHYTIIPNALLRNRDLSIQARGLLAFILSFPDNWEFDRDWLIENSGVKRDRLDTILNELEEKGYLRRTQVRLPNGRVGAWEYLFSQEPMEIEPVDAKVSVPRRGKGKAQEGRQPEKPEAVAPHPGKPEAVQPEPVKAPQQENPQAVSLYRVEDCKSPKTVEVESSWIEKASIPKTGESAQARSHASQDGADPRGYAQRPGQAERKRKPKADKLVELPEEALLPDDWRAAPAEAGMTPAEMDETWDALKRWANGANNEGKIHKRTERGWRNTWPTFWKGDLKKLSRSNSRSGTGSASAPSGWTGAAFSLMEGNANG